MKATRTGALCGLIAAALLVSCEKKEAPRPPAPSAKASAQPAERFVSALRTEGLTDVRVDGTVLSVGIMNTPVTTPAVVRRLVEAGAGVESVVPEQPPLEDVYLKLIDPDGDAS